MNNKYSRVAVRIQPSSTQPGGTYYVDATTAKGQIITLARYEYGPDDETQKFDLARAHAHAVLNTNEPKREVMQSHKGDKRCICSDGREDERDVCETCDSDIEDRT